MPNGEPQLRNFNEVPNLQEYAVQAAAFYDETLLGPAEVIDEHSFKFVTMNGTFIVRQGENGVYSCIMCPILRGVDAEVRALYQMEREVAAQALTIFSGAIDEWGQVDKDIARANLLAAGFQRTKGVRSGGAFGTVVMGFEKDGVKIAIRTAQTIYTDHVQETLASQTLATYKRYTNYAPPYVVNERAQVFPLLEGEKTVQDQQAAGGSHGFIPAEKIELIGGIMIDIVGVYGERNHGRINDVLSAIA